MKGCPLFIMKTLNLTVVVICSHPASTLETVMGLLSILPETCVEIILCTRNTDPLLPQYDAVYEKIPIEAKTLVVFESELDSAVTNEAVAMAQCDLVMAVQDGMTFKEEEGEEGELEKVMESVVSQTLDNLFIIFPSSQYRSPIISKRALGLLGYYAFPMFEESIYHDKWLGSIFYDMFRMFQATVTTTTDSCRKSDSTVIKQDENNYNNLRSIRNRHLAVLVNHSDKGDPQ